jgi:Uma2 family endonuclease
MAEPIPTPAPRMSSDEFLRWAEAQPRGRFELVAGEVVAMAPERSAHNDAKQFAWLALHRAITEAGLPCYAKGDGMAVEVDDTTVYEPDALVYCGERMDPDATRVPPPIIVVEVTSPSTRQVDTGTKLTDYFRLALVAHYLVVRTDRRQVIHHRRIGAAEIFTQVHASGPIALDPPGITIRVEDLFEG